MMKIFGIGILAYLLFELQRRIYAKLWNKNLLIKVAFGSSYIFEGEEGELREVIENRKWLPLSMLKVKFQTSRNLIFADAQKSGVTDRYYRNDVFQIGGGERITRTLRFTGGRRGYYHIHSIDLVASDLFLTMEMIESREVEGYLYVYPKPFQSRELEIILRQINGEIMTQRNLLEDPFEYRGIREYQPYDDMRSVNWKATARVQGLMVNQKGYTTHQQVRIFYNIEDSGILKKDEAVESCLQIAAGITRFFLTQGLKVALYGNGLDILSGQPVRIDSSAGSGQLDSIYRALARVDTSRTPAGFVETFGSELLDNPKGIRTFLISPNGYPDFLELLERYQTAGGTYEWFYPVWEKREPELPDWAAPHVKVLHVRG